MRNYKVLGLAVVAALAMSALAASTASATPDTAVIAGDPKLHASDTEGGLTELTGLAGIKCDEATYSGSSVTSTITLTPTFHKCKTSTGAPVTVTHNGCNYVLTLGSLNAAHNSAPVKSIELDCSAGKQVQVHVYGNALHTITACTIELPDQTPTPNNLTVSELAGGHLRAVGSATGTINYVSGPCATSIIPTSHATTQAPDAVLHIDMTIGTAPTGGSLNLVTHTEEE